MILAALLLPALQVSYVDLHATGAGTGTSWTDAYPTLEAALAQPGVGEIWIAAGTYRPGAPGSPLGTSFIIPDGARLYGGFLGTETTRAQRDSVANVVILSGDLNGDDPVGLIDNAYHVVRADGVGPGTTLDGLTIEGGRAVTSTSFDSVGGGLSAIAGSPTLVDVVFRNNLGTQAGGLYLLDSQALVVDCLFQDNRAWQGKGGGAILAGSSDIQMRGCRFLTNRSEGTATQGGGGGLYLDFGSRLVIKNCLFENNEALPPIGFGVNLVSSGGGLLAQTADLSVQDCIFRGNTALEGGAMSLYSSATVVDCLFADNSAVPWPSSFGSIGGYGGAIFTFFNPVLFEGCTVVDNSATEGGAGFWLGLNTTFTLRNSIVWGNVGNPTQPTIKAQISKSAGVVKDYLYSDIQALLQVIPGEPPPDPNDFPGCLDADPQFLALGDYHLGPLSPCRNSGDTAAFPVAIRSDLDGDWRRDRSTGLIDMGAYEAGGGGLLPQLSRLYRGQTFHMHVLGSNQTLQVGGSLNGTGQGPPLTALGGLALDILPPLSLIGNTNVNASGSHLKQFLPPQLAIGQEVALQMVFAAGPSSETYPPLTALVLP